MLVIVMVVELGATGDKVTVEVERQGSVTVNVVPPTSVVLVV